MAGTNWQQLSGGSTNPWTIRRDDGTPTANYSDHIICDGGTVTLPTPQANEAVLVSNISGITEIVPNATETIEGETSVFYNQNNPIAFVSDGVNWYVSNNLNYFDIIPDPIVDDFEYLTDGEAIDGQENWTVAAGVAEGHDGSTNVNTFRGGSTSLLFEGGAPGDIRKSFTAAQWPTVSYIQGIDGGSSDPNQTFVALANSTDGLIFKSSAVDTGSSAEGYFEFNGTVLFSSVADGDEINVDVSIDWENEEVTLTVNGTNGGTFTFLNSTDEADEFWVWSDNTDSTDLGLLDNIEFSD